MRNGGGGGGGEGLRKSADEKDLLTDANALHALFFGHGLPEQPGPPPPQPQPLLQPQPQPAPAMSRTGSLSIHLLNTAKPSVVLDPRFTTTPSAAPAMPLPLPLPLAHTPVPVPTQQPAAAAAPAVRNGPPAAAADPRSFAALAPLPVKMPSWRANVQT